MREATLIAGTVVVGIGLALILWRELAGATERRTVGPVRDTLEVMAPVVASVALVVWVWIAR